MLKKYEQASDSLEALRKLDEDTQDEVVKSNYKEGLGRYAQGLLSQIKDHLMLKKYEQASDSLEALRTLAEDTKDIIVQAIYTSALETTKKEQTPQGGSKQIGVQEVKRTLPATPDITKAMTENVEMKLISDVRVKIDSAIAEGRFEEAREIVRGLIQQFASRGSDQVYIDDALDLLSLIDRMQTNGQDGKDADAASLTEAPGGIDFNSNNMKMNESGQRIEFDFKNMDLNKINPADFRGMNPVIINITPVTNFRLMLGLKDEPKPVEVSMGDVGISGAAILLKSLVMVRRQEQFA